MSEITGLVFAFVFEEMALLKWNKLIICLLLLGFSTEAYSQNGGICESLFAEIHLPHFEKSLDIEKKLYKISDDSGYEFGLWYLLDENNEVVRDSGFFSSMREFQIDYDKIENYFNFLLSMIQKLPQKKRASIRKIVFSHTHQQSFFFARKKMISPDDLEVFETMRKKIEHSRA